MIEDLLEADEIKDQLIYSETHSKAMLATLFLLMQNVMYIQHGFVGV